MRISDWSSDVCSSDLFAVTASRSTRRVWGKSSSMPYGNPYVSPAPDTTVVVGAGEDRVPGGITALLGSAGSGGVIALSPLWPQAANARHTPNGAINRFLRNSTEPKKVKRHRTREEKGKSE